MKVYFWEEKILFKIWTKETGNFDSVQTDINFCKNVIRVLSKKPLFCLSFCLLSNLLLRRSRIKYFKLRYQTMVRLKYRMRKEERRS